MKAFVSIFEVWPLSHKASFTIALIGVTVVLFSFEIADIWVKAEYKLKEMRTNYNTKALANVILWTCKVFAGIFLLFVACVLIWFIASCYYIID